MKKKVLLGMMVFCILLLQLNVVLGYKAIYVDTPVRIDFENTDQMCDIRLMLQGGFERHWTWYANDTKPADFERTHEFLYELDLEDVEYVCEEEQSSINEYKNVTDGLLSMLGVCEDIVVEVNNSEAYRKELDQCNIDKNEYNLHSEIYFEKWEDAKNNSDGCIAKRDECIKKRDSLQSTVNDLSNYKSKYEVCEKDLEDCGGSKNTFGFFGLAIGVGGMYLFMRKKQEGVAPSEQIEDGNMTDYASPMQYPPQPAQQAMPPSHQSASPSAAGMPSFEDGPKESTTNG